MRSIVRGFVSIAAVVSFGACTGAKVLQVDTTPRPATTAALPVLLDEPTVPYRSIALIEVSGRSLDQMAKRLTKEAAKIGGDAVLVTRESSTSTSTLIPWGKTVLSLDGEDTRLVGKVIVYDR